MSRLLDLALRQNDVAKHGEPETEGRAILCARCAEWFPPQGDEQRCPDCQDAEPRQWVELLTAPDGDFEPGWYVLADAPPLYGVIRSGPFESRGHAERARDFLRVLALYGILPEEDGHLQHGEAWHFEIREGYVQAFYTSPVEPSYGSDGLVAEIESPNGLDYFLADTVGA